MNFLEKLDFLMNKYGLNKRTLSQKSQIPYTTIDGWYKKGYEGLKLTTLRKLNDFFNTALDFWILDEITDPNYGKTSGFKVEYDEMEHIKKYRSLDPSGKNRIDYELDSELARLKELLGYKDQLAQAAKELIPKRLWVYYGKIAAAGTSVEFSDMIAGTKEYPLTEINKNADYVIGVNGDSMEPTYFDGDIVYVQRTTTLNVGDIGIFQKDNGIYIKEVGENGLISHNSKYKPMINGGDVLCLGKVLGKAEED